MDRYGDVPAVHRTSDSEPEVDREFEAGRWPAYRIIQAALVVLCFLTMVGSVTSGITLSNYIFVELRIREWSTFAATFEKECRECVTSDSRRKFGPYCEYVINLKEQLGTVKHSTISSYRDLAARICLVIGHIKLKDLRAVYRSPGGDNAAAAAIQRLAE